MKSNLPESWEVTSISKIFSVNPGHSGIDISDDTEVSFVPMPEIEEETGRLNPRVSKLYKDVKKGYTKFAEGDVVFAKITPCMENGKIAIAAGLINGVGCGTTEIFVFRQQGSGLAKYLFYYLVQKNFRQYAKSKFNGAVGHLRVPSSIFDEQTFPLPPLNEQRRIVAQLDAVMQKLEASQERLDKLPELLKKFRQAVLAAAVSGKLTEVWRAEQTDTESANSLINNIIEGRKTRFDKAVACARFEGKKAPRRVFLESHPDVVPSLLPDLPDTWAVTTVGFLAHVTKLAGFEYTNHIRYEEQGDIPVVRAQNVQMGYFTEENILYIDQGTSDFLERSQLHGREVLMVFIGAGTGNVCLAPKDRRWHLAPNVAKIDCDVVSPEYLNYYLQSPVGLRHTLSFAKATAQPSLSMETIREIAVALPPLTEQQEIVRQINHYFELAEQLEVRFEQAAAMVEQLPQALLAKAFSGQLVPQDPTDEPASRLLELLQAEPVASVKGKRGRKAQVATEAPLFE